MGMIQDFKAWTRRDGSPFTTILVASLSLSTLWFTISRFQHLDLIGYAGYGLVRPWTLLTYPWGSLVVSGTSLIGFAFMMVWLYSVCKTIERDVSSRRTAILWFGFTLFGALCNFAGVLFSQTNSVLLGPAIPLAALTVIWCTRNPNATIQVYMVIPVPAKVIGWLAVVAIAVMYGISKPVIGLCDCIPLALAYLFASNRIPGLSYGPGEVFKAREKSATTRGQVMYDQAYFDEVKRRETERAEQERLRKLLGED